MVGATASFLLEFAIGWNTLPSAILTNPPSEFIEVSLAGGYF